MNILFDPFYGAMYMTCLGISVMDIIMLLVMKGMYPSRKNNAGILISCMLLFSVAFSLVRMQKPVKGCVL